MLTGNPSQLTQWPTGKPIFIGKIYDNDNYKADGIWVLHMCHKPDGSVCDLPPVTGKGMCKKWLHPLVFFPFFKETSNNQYKNCLN